MLTFFVSSAGKETRGYDPSQDIEWLHSEVVRWVLGNLMQKWYTPSSETLILN